MKKIIIGVGLMIFSFLADAQIGLKAGNDLFLVENIVVQAMSKIDFKTRKNKNKLSEIKKPTWSFSESNVYDNHFGFFCKVEVKLDKVAKMQTRFRLGSVDYVNELEGK